jgi:hypothetical protein
VTRYIQLTYLAVALTALAFTNRATATVIFEENFASRVNHQQIIGFASPNITNTGGAVYTAGPELALASVAKVGFYGDQALNVKGLLFKPMDLENTPPEEQKAGTPQQTMYLPFQYEFGTDAIRLTLVARKETEEWNNFVFGFSDTAGNISNMLLLQRNPSGMYPQRTRMQLFHNGLQYNRNYTPGIFAGAFHELVLEYDPNKANTAENPYSFYADGTPIPLSTSAVNLAPMTTTGGVGPSSIQGISWGFWSALGELDRSVLIESMKFETFTPEEPSDNGDFNGDGLVDGTDFLMWQRGESTNGLTAGDLQEWKDNFPLGLTAALAPVPEPASGAILAVGAAALLLAKRRRR